MAHEDLEGARARARRFGWTWLFVSALAGLLLEAAQGWKVSAVLDDELTRTLLRLAHAHGVGLSLVAVVHGELGLPLFTREAARSTSLAIHLGAVLVPVGFALGAIGHPEGDPSVMVLFVPLGALSLLYGLFRTLLAAWSSAPTA